MRTRLLDVLRPIKDSIIRVNQGSQQLAASAEQLSSQVEILQNAISFFRTEEQETIQNPKLLTS